MRRTSRFLLISLAALAAGCTAGADYTRPVVEVPSAHRGDTPAAAGTASLGDVAWTEVFRDEALTRLISSALERNFDLRVATERVLQARAAFRITRSDQFPAVDASLGLQAARSAPAGALGVVPPGIDTEVAYTQVGFSLGWELDVWGRLRRLTEAARAQYLATENARRGVITTLIGDVAETYLTLRALDLELEIAQRTQEVARENLRLTEARRERGVASALDVRQAEQLLHPTRVQLATLEREIVQVENAVSLLVGQAPGDIPRGATLETFPVPPAVPAGLPSTLLERRPDIRQAEHALIAANAQIGAARAEYFPRIALTGLLGTQSRALSDLLSGPATIWSAGAVATAPIFNAGRTRANVQLTEALYREAVVEYERVVFTALREVSDALAAYRRTSEGRGHQERLVEALRASTRLSTDRYASGLDSYLPVLDSQRNLFQGELDLARLRRQELAAIVQLYRALGGGWST